LRKELLRLLEKWRVSIPVGLKPGPHRLASLGHQFWFTIKGRLGELPAKAGGMTKYAECPTPTGPGSNRPGKNQGFCKGMAPPCRYGLLPGLI
jgi:hypothetical protein